MAIRAGCLLHELFVVVVAHALCHTLFDDADHAVKLCLLPVRLLAKVADNVVSLVPGAVIQHVQCFRREGVDRLIHREAKPLPDRFKQRSAPAFRVQRLEAVDLNGTLPQRQLRVRDQPSDRHTLHIAETGTLGAGASRVIEGEHTRLQLAEGHTVLLAGVTLRKGHLLFLLPVAGYRHNEQAPLSCRQRRLHRIGQTGADSVTHDQPVHNDLHIVLPVLIQHNLLGQVIQRPIDAHADIPLFLCVRQNLFVHTLLGTHHGGQHQETGSLRQRENLVNDLIHALLAYFPAADRAVGDAHPRIQKAQVVVYLGDSSDGRARIAGGRFLVNGNGGRQSLDHVHVRLVHLSEEHPGVGGQRLHKPPVSLGIDGIKRQ